MTWHRTRTRPSLRLTAFAVAVVAVLFLTVAPEAKHKAEVVTKIVNVAGAHIEKEDIQPLQPAQAKTPPKCTPNEAEVEMLARTIWGEARGIPSDMEKATATLGVFFQKNTHFLRVTEKTITFAQSTAAARAGTGL